MAMTLCVGLTCGISGCHKKVRAPQLPQISLQWHWRLRLRFKSSRWCRNLKRLCHLYRSRLLLRTSGAAETTSGYEGTSL